MTSRRAALVVAVPIRESGRTVACPREPFVVAATTPSPASA